MDAQSLKLVADKNLHSIIISMPPVVFYTAHAFQSLLKSFFLLNTTKRLPSFFLYVTQNVQNVKQWNSHMCVQFLSCFCKLKQKKNSLFDLLIYCKIKTTNAVTIDHVGEENWKIS